MVPPGGGGEKLCTPDLLRQNFMYIIYIFPLVNVELLAAVVPHSDWCNAWRNGGGGGGNGGKCPPPNIFSTEE